MDVDASQYALISKQMFYSGNYLQVMERGHNYLDKPPLIFWTACLSYKVFGIHDWSYRLPSILCLILGIYSVYRFAKLYYDEYSARISALIMASCCATYLMTHDVRTDTMLTGWVMFSLWQLAEFNRSLKFKNIVWGAIGVGLAMLTKGPIGLIIPVTAFSFEFIYKRQWKNFFRWQYLLALVVIAIILLPMSYGLYEQYDMHPESIALNNLKHVSGLRFFYWTQSFGRITGESGWNNNPDPFFLVHSFCWSFLPWIAFFLPALFFAIKDKIKSISNPQGEVISISGFLFVFIFLSLSKYQLPHYTFPLHPLAAIITGSYLGKNILQSPASKTFSVFWGIQVFAMIVLYLGMFLLTSVVFPASLYLLGFITISLLFFIFILFYKTIEKPGRILIGTLVTFITLAYVLNIHFYANLLQYQTSSAVAKDINKMADNDANLLIFNNYAGNSMEFYCKLPITEYINEKNIGPHLTKGKTYILANSSDSVTVMKINPEIVAIKDYSNFEVTQLNASFLSPTARKGVLDKFILFKY